ncbi:hypothetical protein Tco_0136357, partial [Tanacetum coccineum]
MMTGTKFDIEKFNGKNNFTLWQVRMKTLLEKQGLAAGLYVRERSGMKIRYPVLELMGITVLMKDYLVDFEEYDGCNILFGYGRECRVTALKMFSGIRDTGD